MKKITTQHPIIKKNDTKKPKKNQLNEDTTLLA